MSNNQIEEVTLISDDDEEEIIPPQLPKKPPTPPATPASIAAEPKEPVETSKLESNNASTPQIDTSKSFVSNEEDNSDCEITEITIIKPREEPVKLTETPKQAPAQPAEPIESIAPEPVTSKTPSTEKAAPQAVEIPIPIENDSDSDLEITEIVSKPKPTTTTSTESSSIPMITEEPNKVASSIESTVGNKAFDVSITTVVTKDTTEVIPQEVKVPEPVVAEKVPVVEANVVANVSSKPNRPKAKAKRRFKCCNNDCPGIGGNFVFAESSVRSFYSVTDAREQQIHRVCDDCLKKVTVFEESLVALAEAGQPLVNSSYMVPSRDTVMLEDSDEEMELNEDGSKLLNPENEMVEVDMEEFDDVLRKMWEQYRIEEQIGKCVEAADKRQDDLRESMADLEVSFGGLQTNLDAMRKRLYEPWNPIFKELPPIEIVDVQYDDPPPIRQESDIPVATKSTSARSPRVVAMKKVTHMHKPNITIKPADQGMEIQELGEVEKNLETVPPLAPLPRPSPNIGDTVYAQKTTLFAEWLKAKVQDTAKKDGQMTYKVKFLKNSVPTKLCQARQIAYSAPPTVQLQVGTRIIAVFHNSEDESGLHKDTKDHYYAGVIAEQLKSINRNRYLVFFDDGFTQYVPHSKVCVVVGQSRNVWEDCHEDCREFLKTYITQFPERPMVKLQVGQIVKTEWNTRWWLARVRQVDCSLVLVHFDADNRTEWIYRGSTRLGPLYTEMAKKTERQKKGGRLHRSFASSTRKVNAPYVEYTRGPDNERGQDDEGADDPDDRRSVPRSVAKKSTTSRPMETIQGVVPLPNDRKETVGTIKSRNLTNMPTTNFFPHQCSPSCIGKELFREGRKVLQNPMLIPLAHGWGRQCVNFRNNRSQVIYLSPCSRRLRNIQEVHRFLRITKSQLGVDLFSFDTQVHINTEFLVSNPLYSIKDISYGKENVVIPCVNTINHHEYPAYVEYATKRNPTVGVNINSDPGFLVGCDCTDGCYNKSKCACHQLTFEVRKDRERNNDPEKLGYQFKRLYGFSKNSAVYECNSQCKCAATCLNRVVQHPMKVQLQLFKTEKRGWGIRCLNDIPQGTFLCIYAGQVLTEQEGNEEGKDYSVCYDTSSASYRQYLRDTGQTSFNYLEGKAYGDEYLAELDYIEVTEREKEDYESDVSDIEEEDSDTQEDLKDSEEAQKKGSDDEFTVDQEVTASLGEPGRSMTLRKRGAEKEEGAKKKEGTKEKTVAKKSTGAGSKERGEVRAPRVPDGVDTQSVRYHFEHSDDIYVMDAKGVGNIGRYFNHSCDPNVFVQNVFVDTHDLRFPWVAFFTSRFCRAGTELCWNYNYEIDSLPGRRLDCYCESSNCKGRLL